MDEVAVNEANFLLAFFPGAFSRLQSLGVFR
jgi:hypothetical protein